MRREEGKKVRRKQKQRKNEKHFLIDIIQENHRKKDETSFGTKVFSKKNVTKEEESFFQ